MVSTPDARRSVELQCFDANGDISSSPVVWNGTVYVGVANDDGSLIALGGERG
jgi:outer membrane protein assembly factor BamB